MVDIPAYERSPYLTHLEARVLRWGESDTGRFAVLDDTVLYPEGGGQPSDRGTLNGAPVVDVQSVDGEIRHYLSERVGGSQVDVELDWGRRFDHMQQHTAQHLLTAIAQDRFGWSTTAFHLGRSTSDIVIDAANVSDGELIDLEEAVAVEIRAARSVTATRVTLEDYQQMDVRSRGLPEGHQGSVRLVSIEGIDVTTCGGTHCSSTAEIEAVKLLRTDSVRGGTRLPYVAGRRVRESLGRELDRSADLRRLLGASGDDLVDLTSSKLAQLKDAGRTIRSLEEELAVFEAARLVGRGERVIIAHWPSRDLPFLQRVAGEIRRSASDRVALLTAGEEQGSFVLVAGDDAGIDVPTVGAEVAALLEGRGGGSGGIFQGRGRALSRMEEARQLLSS